MAPEQARGETRRLDRRSDVYSLGATLYHLLCGEPPFRADSLAALLFMVIHEEPVRPRKKHPSLPADLETIVLKCLQKEQGMRYESARVLAEDLRRFMDGEPIRGRRVSVYYRLRRIWRRNKGLVALGITALAGISVATAYGLHTKRQAAEQQQQQAQEADLALRLGEEVKELEWLMRVAYTLPLHDVRPEQERVRQRMAWLEKRMLNAGPRGKSLAQWALGMGARAMHDPASAKRHLQGALTMAPHYPQIYYALGHSLVQLYQKALAEARHRGNASWLAKRQEALAAELLRPALDYLEKSRHGVVLDSPAYLEGILAFYRKDYAQALTLSQRAASELPWLYEARQLEGDIHLELANQKKERGANPEAEEHFAQALAAYKKAAEIGRSDAEIYESMAEVLIRTMELDFRQGRSPAAKLPQALEVCDQAIAAAPWRSTGYTKKSFAYLFVNQYLTNAKAEHSDFWRKQREAAEQAITLNSEDFFALEALSRTYADEAYADLDAGKNPLPAANMAISYLDRALKLDPGSPWGAHDLGASYTRLGRMRQRLGLDPTDSYAKAESLLQKAIALDPAYNYAYWSLANLQVDNILYSTWTGKPGNEAAAAIAKALASTEACLALNPNEFGCIKVSIWARINYANYQLESQSDPSETIHQTLSLMDKYKDLIAREPQDTASDLLMLRVVELAFAIKTGAPTAAVYQALCDLSGECRHAGPATALCDRHELHASILHAREHALHDRSLQALQALRKKQQLADELVKRDALEPRAHWLRVELYLRLAEALQKLGRPSAAEIEAGLAAAKEGLSHNPSFPYTLAAQGAVQTLKARQATDLQARAALAAQARETLERAIALNPFLKPGYDSYRQAAASLSTRP